MSRRTLKETRLKTGALQGKLVNTGDVEGEILKVRTFKGEVLFSRQLILPLLG